MSTGNRIVKNTAFLYAKMGITMFISLYTTRLILGSLGASDFGIFNIVGGAIAMLGFLNGSMAAATQRYMSFAEGQGNEAGKKRIFNSTIILHIAISLIVVVILEILAVVFFNGVLSIPTDRLFAAKFIYHCAVVATMFSIQAVPFEAIINAHENMLYFAAVGVFESLMKLGVAFVVVYCLMDKLIIYGILMALIALIMRVIMGCYCSKRYSECTFHPRKYVSVSLAREMGIFAFWNATSSVAQVISYYGMGVALNHFFGTIVNAAQGITNQISGQFGVLSTHAKKALNPVIVKSAGAEDYTMMYKATLWGNKVLFFLSSVIFLAILSNLDNFLRLWLKEIPDYTHIFVTLYLIVNMLNTLASCFPVAISAIGKIRNYQICMSCIEFIPLVGGVIAFSCGQPPYFIYILMITVTALSVCFRCYFAHSVCGFKVSDIIVDNILRSAFTFVLALAVAIVISRAFAFSHTFLGLVFIACLEIAIYALLYFFIVFSNSDRKYILSKIKMIKPKIKR